MMNMLFRAVQENDFERIYALALESGIGITTLPKDKKTLKTRIQKAIQSFSNPINEPYDEYYLFVLEDLDKKIIVGTAAIESVTGKRTPFYSYKWFKEKKSHSALNISVIHEYLELSYDNEGKSEVCTLYLAPDYRHSGNGLLLSLARFLFMYHFPSRFSNSVIAELRGVSLDGSPPFWHAVGQLFFNMSFKEADERTISTNKNFIADLIPRHPIYVNLLNEQVKKVIGVPDPVSQPAMNILIREGFVFNQTVDIFDAGPTLEAKMNDIRTIKNVQKLILCIIQKHDESTQRVLLSNASLSFRAIFDIAKIDFLHKKCFVTSLIAKKLELKEGDFVFISNI
jgi:arginine N-succinyltransferase